MSDDKRPRIYTQIQTTYGTVELTVQGSEGETTEDIESTFDDKLDCAVSKQSELADENSDDKREVN